MDFFYALERHNNLCAIRNKRDMSFSRSGVPYAPVRGAQSRTCIQRLYFKSTLGGRMRICQNRRRNNRLSVHTLRQIQSVGIPSLNFSHNGDGDPLSITFKGENIDSIFFSFIIKLANLQNNLLISDMENTLANCAAEYTPDVNPKLAEDFLVCLYENDASYFRQDHDPERADGTIHPLKHLDIFYSDRSSVKYGTNSMLDHSDLSSMVSKKTPAYYLSASKK